MLVFIWIGMLAGLALYITKWASFSLLCPKRIKHWIHQRPIAMGILDIVFGFAGMHIVSIAGGVIAMMTMIFFSVYSMIYIISVMVLNRHIIPTYQKYKPSFARGH
jgi:MFS family permease